MIVVVRFVAFITSSLLLGAFIIGNYQAWATSHGQVAQGILLAKEDKLPPKSMVRIYTFHLAFKTAAGEEITADPEVFGQCYETYAVRDTLTVRYDVNHPKNAAPAFMHWFQPRSLGVLALGLALLITGFTAKRKVNS